MSLKQDNGVIGFFVFENKAKLYSEVDIARRVNLQLIARVTTVISSWFETQERNIEISASTNGPMSTKFSVKTS